MTTRQRRAGWCLIGVGGLVIAVTAMPVARAQDAGAPATDAGALDVHAGPTAQDPRILDIERETRDVQALTRGQLDPATDPSSLFDVSLADDEAVQVDAERLRALLRELDRAVGSTEKPARSGKLPRDAGTADAGWEPGLWKARVALDRARLSFYEIAADRRREILAAHGVDPPDAGAPTTPAELRDQDAAAQRQAALAAARSARARAEQLVSTELGRLLDIERAQSALAADLSDQRRRIAEEGDVTVGWQQRSLEARSRPGEAADTTYEELRRALRSARDALSAALDELGAVAARVPAPGPDALSGLVVAVDTSAVRAARDRLEVSAGRLRDEQESVRQERAAQLFDEIDKLNTERLALLSALTPEKRRAVTGFSAAGWEQATSEARQLGLLLRYHRYTVGHWLLGIRAPGRAVGDVVVDGAVEAFEWLLALGAFVWWRRRANALLTGLHTRAEEADQRAHPRTPSAATRLLAFVPQVRRPIEWLVLLLVLRSLLQASTQQILEVRIFSVLVMWVFGAALVVDTVNALAGSGRREGPSQDVPASAALRLRSLRLVARVVVVFGLILVISSMLVGRGAIYRWVLSTSWLASFPLLLVLVRWWQPVVFRRTEMLRRRSRIQRWVLENRTGMWRSFVAAAVGGAILLGSGLLRGARVRVGGFVITRRALAYLFRRELDKREHSGAVGPIDAAAFAAMGPEVRSDNLVSTDADDAIERLAARIRERRGGLVAIVGDRGMGKSTLLRRLQGAGGDTLLIDAADLDEGALCGRLAEGVGLDASATLEESAGALAASNLVHALLLDNASRFVQPVMGGLATFDALLATAGHSAGTTTWVLALDRVIWQFLERARDSRPLFDEVIYLDAWREEQIVHLLRVRTEEVGLSPSFESLLDPLRQLTDEIDRQDALAGCAADYYRLLWDAASGNPGIALDMWRRSIGADADGATVIRPSVALDTSDLERLPDPSVFVLRAVLQLAPARAADIVKATLMGRADVASALRHAASRGYVEDHQGGYRVTWMWLRAISLFLQRKHLLVTR